MEVYEHSDDCTARHCVCARHTPGPWRVGPGRHSQTICVLDGMRVCADVLGDSPEADARLIAAAPEMRDALAALLATFRECIGHAAFADFERDNDAVIAAQQMLRKTA